MISKLHYITQRIGDQDHDELAARACAAGVRWVQLRVKNSGDAAWKELAVRTKRICEKFNATFIVNDNVALAKEINAHGVHLGKEDMDPREAKKMLGNGFIIGGTANTFEDIQRLAEAGVDYIGLGPFRFTTTKEKLSPVLGIEGYRNIVKKMNAEGIDVPVIAIGGIQTEDAEEILLSGVHGIAVSSAINGSKYHQNTVNAFLRATEPALEK
jgi:thiamine-phosphate pyrophosphorylase